MPKLKLTYFNFHGGRGEPIRLALHLGGVAFEDFRFTFPEFAEVRITTPLSQVPTLTVDDIQITQSDSILRYSGKLANLYPTDAFQALLCDEVMFVSEEMNIKLGPSFRMTGEEQKAARLALVEGAIPVYLTWLEKQLIARGSTFFADDRLTVADLKVLVDVLMLTSGRLDHIPTDLAEQLAPTVLAHVKRVANLPEVLAYYAKFSKQ
jgi:glutathione S-transferase